MRSLRPENGGARIGYWFQLFAREIFFKCESSQSRVLTCLCGVAAAPAVVIARVSLKTGQIKMRRRDSVPSVQGPANKGSPSRFVSRITVSTHTHVVSCVF